MARHASLRASDADRDSVAERLRQAAVEGRLDADELEERLHAALRARTYGELDRLLADLPGRVVVARPRQTGTVALMLAVRLVAAVAIVAVLMTALALTAAWWLLGVIVVFTMRAARGSCGHCRWHHQRV